MKKRAVLVGALLVLAFAGPVFAMGDRPGEVTSGSWRYKMTVVVETPEGIKTGSAVREVSVEIRRKGFHPEAPGIIHKVAGEAVVVDLGKRGVLFALLKGYPRGEDYAKSIVFTAFPGPPGLTEKGIAYYSRLKDEKKVLEPALYPMLITFTDRNDPKTVTEVLEMKRSGSSPRAPYIIGSDRFGALFGEGVSLKEITIEMTNEPVTVGIERWLVLAAGILRQNVRWFTI